MGSEDRRKNLVNLAMAYMGLAARRRRTPPLLLVGPGSGWAQGGDAMGPQIRAVGYLETREIRALMAASAALVLPSLEEGFGLPVVEAMAAGLPVVCSRGSALEEVAGDAATLVNPLDTRSIADGMEKILDDPARADKQRAMGLDRSRAVRLGHRRRADPGVLPAGPRLLIVGIDGRELAGRPTGTGRYLRNLLRAWSRSGRRPDVRLLRRPGPRRSRAALAGDRAAAAGRRRASRALVVGARAARARRAQDGVDVFFAPAYTCPLSLDVPRVVAVHDVSFFSAPHDFGLDRRVPPARCRRRAACARRASCSPCSDFTPARDRGALPRRSRARRRTFPHGRDDDLPPAPDRARARGRRSASRAR